MVIPTIHIGMTYMAIEVIKNAHQLLLAGVTSVRDFVVLMKLSVTKKIKTLFLVHKQFFIQI